MMLLPPQSDRCPVCAGDHPQDYPHNRDSLYYQMAFRAQRGRWPTWDDAMAHCSPDMQEDWRSALHGMAEEAGDATP